MKIQFTYNTYDITPFYSTLNYGTLSETSIFTCQLVYQKKIFHNIL